MQTPNRRTAKGGRMSEELERLKVKFQMAQEWNQLTEIDLKNLRQTVAEQYQDLQLLKALCLRAANKFDDMRRALNFVHSSIWEAYEDPELISDLRKALEAMGYDN